jgi:hypothetical protein
LETWVNNTPKFLGLADSEPASVMTRAAWISTLAGLYVSALYEGTGFHVLKHNAGTVQWISFAELKDIAQNEGIAVDEDWIYVF